MARAKSKALTERRKFGRRSAFVKSEVVRLALFDGDLADEETMWIDVHKRITYGAQQEVAGKMLESLILPDSDEDDEVSRSVRKQRLEVSLDVAADGPATILAWLIDWNFEDHEGTPIAVSYDSVLDLDVEVGNEIKRVLEKHSKSGN